MKPELLDVKVAGVGIKVPVYEDRKTTLDLVQRVEARVQEIERQSKRIDTQAFALLAAVSFAREVAEVQQARNCDDQEMLSALSEIAKTLKVLTDKFTPGT